MANKHNTQNPRLCALRVADPDAFVKEVTTAIQKHDGVLLKVAESLDVSHRTMLNWISEYPQLGKWVKDWRRPYSAKAEKKSEKPARKRKKKAA